jgi:hypothetical protein
MQVSASSIDALTFTDASGNKHNVVAYARAHAGERVILGTGARAVERELEGRGSVMVTSMQARACDSKLSSRRCVSDAMSLLVSPTEFARIPQPSDDLLMTALRQIFSNSRETKFLPPSKWGFLRDPQAFRGAVEDVCQQARLDDRFVLRVTLPNTSLHCVAVRDRQICDLATGLGWLTLTSESFATLGIQNINAGFKVVDRTLSRHD